MPDSTSHLAPARDLPPAGLVDVDAIEARALAAPGGTWEAYPDKVRIPWTADEDETDDGRYLVFYEGDWHLREDVPEGLWPFLETARDDVLALVALARWLSGALAAALATSDVTVADHAGARQ